MAATSHHGIVACIFACTLVAYLERQGFSIAFTSLASSAELDQSTKGGVLSAFFYGYAIMQVPGGWLAAKLGGTRVLSISFATWSLLSIVMPSDAESDKAVAAIVLCRLLIGGCQGMFIPAAHTVLARWIPPMDRSRLVSTAMSGMYLGNALSMLVMPPLVEKFGPGAEFRTAGALGLCWLLLWCRMGRDEPVEGVKSYSGRTGNSPVAAEQGLMTRGLTNRTFSESRRQDGSLSPARGNGAPHRKAHPPCCSGPSGSAIPWGGMLRSSASWAIIGSNFAFHYGVYMVMNWLPTYFEQYLGAPLVDLGALKTLPYLAMFVASNAGGLLGQYLVTARKFSVLSSRRAVNSLGFLSTALCLIMMALARSWRHGVVWTTLTMTSLGLCRGGWAVNHMDIAPRHAGVLMAISNGAGTLAGVVGVAVTGSILDRFGGAGEAGGWLAAMGLEAIICICAALYFTTYAQAKVLFP